MTVFTVPAPQPAAGISIVSPSTALCVGPLITAFTSVCWHEAASTVVPVLWARTAGPQMTSSVEIIARRLIRLNTDTGSFVRARYSRLSIARSHSEAYQTVTRDL